MQEMTPVKAIKTYMEEGEHGRKVTLDELKALENDERKSLAQDIAQLIGDIEIIEKS